MSADMLDFVVTGRELHGSNILVVELQDPDGQDLPAFDAGAHVDVEVAPGLMRQYSLCNDPAERHRYRLGILRVLDSRGGSRQAHELLVPGRKVRIGRPRNQFPLDLTAQYSVLVGGGIGITPILAMAFDLHSRGMEFELHYCARSGASAAFLDELKRVPFAERVKLHFDDATDGARLDPQADLPAPASGTQVYFCGPEGFMTWLAARCEAMGYTPKQLHREHFSADVSLAGDSFEVVLQRSGLTVPVPEGTSIVKALAKAGIRVETMCGQGICGTCLTDVLEGIPDHRDSFLTDEEHAANDQMTLCCSRALTARLVLDL